MSKLKSRALRLVPRSTLLAHAPASPPALYLTFDDGPHPQITGELLDLLGRYGARGSFFCIGQLLESRPELARKIVAEGHLLANHSYFHNRFSSMPLASQIEEVDRTDAVIQALTSHQNKYFRAPQGRWSVGLIWRLRRRGKVSVHWTYDSMDYQQSRPEKIIRHFENHPVTNGDVILFHDDLATCTGVLECMIPRWLAEGYRLLRVDEA